MFDMKALDVGIGMALMFLFVSLICSAVREFGELAIKTRASSLERGVAEMLGEAEGPGSIVERFYNQPMISSLFEGTYVGARPGSIARWLPWIGQSKLPSYIPAENFAQAMLQIAREEAKIPLNVAVNTAALRQWVGTSSGSSHLTKAIGTALDTAGAKFGYAVDTAGNDLGRTQKALEGWFDSTMDRVSGWYKRRTQIWLFVIGFACAALMNIDAIAVLKALSADQHLRDQVVQTASAVLTHCQTGQSGCLTAPGAPVTGDQSVQTPSSLEHIKDAAAQVSQIDWPMGWEDDAPSALFPYRPGPQYRVAQATLDGRKSLPISWWLPVLGGWLVTAFGVTFGASFWFDVLNRLMVVRSTIKPDEKSPKEKSKS